MQIFKQVDRWFTSELEFKNSADMLRCKKELEEASQGEHYLLTVEAGETGVHFSGSFDFSNFDEQFNVILTGYDLKENYKIKCVFTNADGYFGGWVEEYSPKGEVIDTVSLNEFFDREMTHEKINS